MSSMDFAGGYNECVSFIPECEKDLKPYVGQIFNSVELGYQFYKVYAGECGFDIRLSTVRKSKHDVVLHRYIVCNREGLRPIVSDDVNDNSLIKRRRNTRSCRISCMARIILKKSLVNGYEVTTFNESHSHPLLSGGQKQFLKMNRKMDYTHKRWFMHCRRVNIGPQRSFKLFMELSGSFESVGCSKVDFKNFSRDVHQSVVGLDSQVVVDDFKKRMSSCSGFFFDYCVDDNNKLSRLFWADAVSIQNYKRFGEAVSFDATYSTNQYNMVFAPFTGKDNHGRCVTFGAGLLNREDEESYAWLLNNFLKCMSGKSPVMFITYQDPALINAVPKVFPEARHRFCMWHIMLKVADKLPVSLKSDEEFTYKFNDIVWSEDIEPFEFDQRWCSLMQEYGLTGHKWFSKMYDCRYSWIPAFFRDLHMSGLFKTTSLSESENNFFQSFMNRNANLIEFLMYFRSALDQQRHTHLQLSSNDVKSSPNLNTTWAIEKHAASVYTYDAFKKVQVQIIQAMKSCGIVKLTTVVDATVYEVEEFAVGKFTIVYAQLDKTLTCSCKLFVRKGILCSHVFFLLKNLFIEAIPDIYVLQRWSKNACYEHGFTVESDVHQADLLFDNRDLFFESHRCISLVESRKELKAELLSELKKFSERVSRLCNSDGGSNVKKNMVHDFYGCEIPESISVLSPSPVKTKGSGSRLKSRREKAIRVANKPKRRCGKCKEMTNHDARNCNRVTNLVDE